jgi:hypothetical protein
MMMLLLLCFPVFQTAQNATMGRTRPLSHHVVTMQAQKKKEKKKKVFVETIRAAEQRCLLPITRQSNT